MAAPLTPGSRLKPREERLWKALRFALAVSRRGRANCIVNRFRGSKPASTSTTRSRLFIINPAPSSNTSESAISDTTRRLRIRWRVNRSTGPPPSLRLSCSPARVSLSAGTRPKTSPVIKVIAQAKASIGENRSGGFADSVVEMIGRDRGCEKLNPRTRPATRPSCAADQASSRLSVSSCRIDTPAARAIACRIAISFCRAAERASNRFATFAQAIKSTNPTSASKTIKTGLTAPTICSCNSTTECIRGGVILRVLLFDSFGDRAHIRAGLLDCHSGLEPGDDVKPCM